MQIIQIQKVDIRADPKEKSKLVHKNGSKHGITDQNLMDGDIIKTLQ